MCIVFTRYSVQNLFLKKPGTAAAAAAAALELTWRARIFRNAFSEWKYSK